MYKLTQIEEPTDQQLNKLMHDVVKKVVKRAKIADKKFRDTMKKDFMTAQKKYKALLPND